MTLPGDPKRGDQERNGRDTAWSDTRRVLEEALALPSAERPAFVRRATAGAPELERDVLTLLAHDDESDDLLDGSAARHLETPDDTVPGPSGSFAPDRDLSGSTIGTYHLEAPIGTGGTSTVYRARAADGRVVALKLLEPALVRGELGDRFHAECEVLSALSHPGIVRLVDAGSDGGQPFLAMELVDGLPIDRYARERLATHRERLELFLEFASAIQHAHAHLVVHRDLKPRNVLVTREGQPKVLDFGVAKLLDASGGHTRTGRRAPLTPGYASPEQVEGGDITTASDVYSAGVLLRELLTGRPPRRDGTPPPRSPELRGDIGTVLDRATRTDPRERYSSIQELAADVRRVLAHRPIEAQRPSFARVAAKWARRNPVPAAIATAGLVAVLLALVLTQRSLDRTRASEGVAWRAHANAVWVTDFWAEVMERVASGEGDVRGLLAEADARIAADLSEWPEAEARTRNGLARVYASLGAWNESRTQAERALALARSTHGLASPDVASNLALLGEAYLELEDDRAQATIAELGELASTSGSRTLVERHAALAERLGS